MLKVKHIKISTGESTESIFESAEARDEHYAKYPELLIDYVNEETDITNLVVKTSKVSKRTETRTFCLKLIDEIAAINEDMNDPNLMAALFSQPSYVAIILALVTGGLKSARALIEAHGVVLYPIETVSSILAQIDAFLLEQNPPAPEPEPEPETPPEEPPTEPENP